MTLYEEIELKKVILTLALLASTVLFGVNGVDSELVEIKNHLVFEKGSVKKAEGTYRYYYDSGVLRKEVSYHDGVLSGVFKEFRRNGTIRLEVTYKDGKAISGRTYRADGRKEKELNRLDFVEMAIEC